ncbi:hypothetical protein CVT26_010405 [Gymnopilus dilepis]|uniref:Uncharacterized protein n=1 Tax=Gymnopilus dilepis TaxID=231916 RepID=A0A409VZ69_9AGAR|nr:hypothetical protein CVT26_010405 [Gymnopilus dilepis]
MDGTLLAIGNDNGELEIRSSVRGGKEWPLMGLFNTGAAIRSLLWHPILPKTVLVGSANGLLHHIALSLSGDHSVQYAEVDGFIHAMAMNPDGQDLVIAYGRRFCIVTNPFNEPNQLGHLADVPILDRMQQRIGTRDLELTQLRVPRSIHFLDDNSFVVSFFGDGPMGHFSRNGSFLSLIRLRANSHVASSAISPSGERLAVFNLSDGTDWYSLSYKKYLSTTRYSLGNTETESNLVVDIAFVDEDTVAVGHMDGAVYLVSFGHTSVDSSMVITIAKTPVQHLTVGNYLGRPLIVAVHRRRRSPNESTISVLTTEIPGGRRDVVPQQTFARNVIHRIKAISPAVELPPAFLEFPLANPPLMSSAFNTVLSAALRRSSNDKRSETPAVNAVWEGKYSGQPLPGHERRPYLPIPNIPGADILVNDFADLRLGPRQQPAVQTTTPAERPVANVHTNSPDLFAQHSQREVLGIQTPSEADSNVTFMRTESSSLRESSLTDTPSTLHLPLITENIPDSARDADQIQFNRELQIDAETAEFLQTPHRQTKKTGKLWGVYDPDLTWKKANLARFLAIYCHGATETKIAEALKLVEGTDPEADFCRFAAAFDELGPYTLRPVYVAVEALRYLICGGMEPDAIQFLLPILVRLGKEENMISHPKSTLAKHRFDKFGNKVGIQNSNAAENGPRWLHSATFLNRESRHTSPPSTPTPNPHTSAIHPPVSHVLSGTASALPQPRSGPSPSYTPAAPPMSQFSESVSTSLHQRAPNPDSSSRMFAPASLHTISPTRMPEAHQLREHAPSISAIFSTNAQQRHMPRSGVEPKTEPISSATTSTSLSSALGRVIDYKNSANVGGAGGYAVDGQKIYFYYTVDNGPVDIERPTHHCVDPPQPGDLYFHQTGRLRPTLDNCQVFFFNQRGEWEDITESYYTWDRGIIYHPVHRAYVLNRKDNDFPSYIKKESWEKAQKNHGYGPKSATVAGYRRKNNIKFVMQADVLRENPFEQAMRSEPL